MRSFNFPIADISENKIVSTAGDNSYFYELEGIDLEQLSGIEKHSLFNSLRTKLNTVEPNSWFKLFRIKGNLYLNTSVKDEVLGLNIFPCNKPLEVFFDNTDIYSDIG